MTGRKEIGGRRGPVAALFVLFGLLLNVATATGSQLDRDPRGARLGNGEIVRTASAARLASRAENDGTDRDELLASLPPAPRPVALAFLSHPADTPATSVDTTLRLDLPASYRARAPPVA